MGGIISQQRPAATCALPVSSLHAPQGQTSSCGGSWSTKPIPEETSGSWRALPGCCAPSPAPHHISTPMQTSTILPVEQWVPSRCIHSPPAGNWDAGSAPSCPPAAPESRCSWLSSPPTNASLSMEEREEASCFSKGQLVAQGSQPGRFLPQGKGEGRTPPSARHGLAPTAGPSAGLLIHVKA